MWFGSTSKLNASFSLDIDLDRDLHLAAELIRVILVITEYFACYHFFFIMQFLQLRSVPLFSTKRVSFFFSFFFSRDATMTSIINCLTSLLAGFVVFSVLGYMAHMQNVSVEALAVQGM